MTDTSRLEKRLARAEARVRWLAALVLLTAVGWLIGAAPGRQEVLRVRGLVITDDAGRDRVVIGAPMAAATTDPRLRETVGLAVLDPAGRLHVSVGAGNPLVTADGSTGERIAAAAGVTFYDLRDGRERGGMGVLADGRANVCLDYHERGKEAACLAVAPDDRYAAVILNGTPNEEAYDRVTMYVDAEGRGSIKAFGGGDDRGGVMIRAGEGPVSVTVYDSAGEPVADLARRVDGG